MEAWNYTLWLPEYSIQYMDICDNSVREYDFVCIFVGNRSQNPRVNRQFPMENLTIFVGGISRSSGLPVGI